MYRNPELIELERLYGVVMPEVTGYAEDHDDIVAYLAQDAQPQLVTNPNTGIPAQFTTIISQKRIRVLLQPMQATKILGGEQRVGDWLMDSAQFPIIDGGGETSSYGDYNDNGSNFVNFNFVRRESYHFQTFVRWGEKENARVGLMGINYKDELDARSIDTLNRFQNKSYIFGVSGLVNYGLLNDPGLPPAITPSIKAAGGTTWAKGTPNENFADVQTLVSQLISQTKGIITKRSPMTLVMPPAVENTGTNSNSFATSFASLMQQNYPNITIETVPEYATAGGNIVQLIAKELGGQEVGYTAFTEKLRTHQIVPHQSGSAWQQKRSQGTWGAHIFQPLAYAQMIGV